MSIDPSVCLHFRGSPTGKENKINRYIAYSI